MPLGRVGADELPFLGEEMNRVWVWADAVEALARGGHPGGGDGHSFMRAMGERRGDGRLLGRLWGGCGCPRLRCGLDSWPVRSIAVSGMAGFWIGHRLVGVLVKLARHGVNWSVGRML